MRGRPAGGLGDAGRAAARAANALVAVLALGAATAAASPAAGADPGLSPQTSGSHRLAAAPAGPAAYEARCSLHPSFRQLQQASAHRDGECVRLRGQVFQLGPAGDRRTMLLDVTSTGGGIWDTTVAIDLAGARTGRGVAVDDIVDVWGTVVGSTTARTRFGGRVHVPLVHARYLALRQAVSSTATTPAVT